MKDCQYLLTKLNTVVYKISSGFIKHVISLSARWLVKHGVILYNISQWFMKNGPLSLEETVVSIYGQFFIINNKQTTAFLYEI